MVAVVSIPTVHLRNFTNDQSRPLHSAPAYENGMSRASRSSRLRWLAHPRPRAKPVEIAPGQSCDLCIQVQICNERSTERCANIASKSCNGFVHLRFKQGSGAGSRSVERSGAFTFGLALFIIRTKEELRVNGDPMGLSLAHELSGLGSTRVVRFHASAGRRINEPDDMATGPQDGQIL